MRGRTLEQSVVHSDLTYWGYWKGRQYAANGYSPMNTLSQIMSGVGGHPSHKILCLDMKPRAWQINSRVIRLPEELRAVLVARYCLPCKADGQPYQICELAPILGISESLYRHRLTRARQAYEWAVFALTPGQMALNS